MTQKGEQSDRFLSTAITERLFRSKEMEEWHAGHKSKVELSDLASRNIQRGRDHGLPSYHKYRIWANLSDITQIAVQPCLSCCRWVVLQNSHFMIVISGSSVQYRWSSDIIAVREGTVKDSLILIAGDA